MKHNYYINMFDILDTYRLDKYQKLFYASLDCDMSKWTENRISDTKVRYTSPDYNNTKFCVEFWLNSGLNLIYVHFNNSTMVNGYLTERKELLYEDKFPSDVETIIKKLRSTVFTEDVYEIEKVIGVKHNRKEKLDVLEQEQMKLFIDSTYEDWEKSFKGEIESRMIARLIHSYHKDQDIYNLWIDKFSSFKQINEELNKL